jgi:hypothetical protein
MRYRFRRLNWCAWLERCTCQAKAWTVVSQLCCDGDLKIAPVGGQHGGERGGGGGVGQGLPLLGVATANPGSSLGTC